jgi:ADP-ribose pyrophosphatase
MGRGPALQEERLSSERVFEGRVVRVEVDTVRLPDGRETRREVVRHGDAVMLIPWLDEEHVVLVRQFRYAVGQALLELPAGLLDRPGEAIESCAQRELREETGYRAAHLEKVVTFYTTPGFTDEVIHCFRATGLTPEAGEDEADERLEVVPMAHTEALELIRRGEIRDGKTILGLLWEKGFPA